MWMMTEIHPDGVIDKIYADSDNLTYRAHMYHLVALFAGILSSIIVLFNIFKPTRYLVYMITKVLVDFFPFFCVFCTSICMYGILNIYLQEKMGEKGLISEVGNPPTIMDGFMVSWSIMLVDHDYEYKTTTGSLIYLVFTIWLIIIMLNLLIAIISNTFAKVQETKKATDYKMKASLILQISHIR